MFKLESYITPLILSYVDKYVKNVKAERSQVSGSLYHSLFQQQNKHSQDVLQYSYDQNYLWGALIEQNLTLNVVLYFMIEW